MVSDEQDRVWEFVAAPPHGAPGVTSMVGYRAFGVPGELHRGMPSSTLTFIVSLDDGVEAAATAQALHAARPNPLLLGGLQEHAAHVRQRPGQAGVQLAVHPLAARALFGIPSSELSASEFDATTVLGRRGIELRERVSDAQQWRDAFSLISEYLIGARRRSDDAMVRPEVAFAWKLLQRSRGRVAVSAVADRVDMTTRHLATLFHKEVGQSPKAVAMLMRFEHATARIAASVQSCAAVDLATVAADTGYSDQAHLAREFVRYTGVPPSRWVAEEFRNIQDGGHSSGADCGYDCSESDCVVTLQAHDAPKLIDYLVDTFGFVLAARYGDGETVDHAQLNWPEGSGGIMLGSHKPGAEWCREPGTTGGYIVTADPDAIYERVQQCHADVVRPIGETDYGAREFAVRDPEGNMWSVGDYRGAALPA